MKIPTILEVGLGISKLCLCLVLSQMFLSLRCDQMETLLETSQLLLSGFLKIQACMILEKATKPFITLFSQRDRLQLLPSAETWVIQHMAGLYPKDTPDPPCSPSSLAGPDHCYFTAGSRTPPRALLQHPH